MPSITSRRQMLGGTLAAGVVAMAPGLFAASLPRRPVRFAYVGSFTPGTTQGVGLNVFARDVATGRWSHVQMIDGRPNPYSVSVNARHSVLYNGNRGHTLDVFRINRSTGRLTWDSHQELPFTSATNCALDPTGRFLVVACYGTVNSQAADIGRAPVPGGLVVMRVLEDGALSAPIHVHHMEGQLGPLRPEQNTSHPHEIVFDPAGRYFCVPNKGFDTVTTFELDARKGALSQVRSVKTRSAAGPRQMVFHGGLPIAYVLNETDSTIGVYNYEPASGGLTPLQLLSTLPTSYVGDNSCSTLDFQPAGRLLLAINRGQGTIARYRADRRTGLLTPLGWTKPPFAALGSEMSPDRRALWVYGDDFIIIYPIATDGRDLGSPSQQLAVSRPRGVAFL